MIISGMMVDRLQVHKKKNDEDQIQYELAKEVALSICLPLVVYYYLNSLLFKQK